MSQFIKIIELSLVSGSFLFNPLKLFGKSRRRIRKDESGRGIAFHGP